MTEDQDRAAIDRAVLAVLLACRDGLTAYAIGRQLGTSTGRVDLALRRLLPALHVTCTREPWDGPGGERLTWRPRIYPDRPR